MTDRKAEVRDGERSRRILVTHNSIAESAVRLLNENDIDVFFSPPYDPPETVAARVADLNVDAIMVRQGKINDLVIGASAELKVIVKHGVGVDNVDLAAAARRGIPVLRSIGSNARAVAEHAISLTLALIKNVLPLTKAVAQGEWPKPSFIGRDIAGSSIGLVGFGAIGQETARLASALGMSVCIYDPFAYLADHGYEKAADIDALISAVDIVSLHCPLTNETRNFMNERRLKLMRREAFLVNTARGGLIDEAALAAALTAGTIAGAAIDSFASEPPSTGNPLFGAPNLLMTPHIGGVTKGSARTMAETAARHIIHVLDGNPPDEKSLAHPDNLAA